jgi:hypothetical protein
LLTIQPADQSGEKKPGGEDVDHGGSLRQTMRIRLRSAELWDITGFSCSLTSSRGQISCVHVAKHHVETESLPCSPGRLEKISDSGTANSAGGTIRVGGLDS